MPKTSNQVRKQFLQSLAKAEPHTQNHHIEMVHEISPRMKTCYLSLCVPSFLGAVMLKSNPILFSQYINVVGTNMVPLLNDYCLELIRHNQI